MASFFRSWGANRVLTIWRSQTAPFDVHFSTGETDYKNETINGPWPLKSSLVLGFHHLFYLTSLQPHLLGCSYNIPILYLFLGLMKPKSRLTSPVYPTYRRRTNARSASLSTAAWTAVAPSSARRGVRGVAEPRRRKCSSCRPNA